MTVHDLDRIMTHYTAMRQQGMDLKTSLDQLQNTIEMLGSADKIELSRRLREIETQEMPVQSPSQPDPEETIEYPALDLGRISCPHCGKSNKKGEVLCYSCGQILNSRGQSRLQTQMLHQTAQLSPNDDYFGEDSVLVFTAQHTRKDYTIRPQDHEGDLVIGRRTPRSPLNPDLDLSDSDGNRLGVSRLHLSIRHDPQYNTVTIFDLGSANGSFVNGQRLHPHEVRVLRHSDELRLGHMLLQVSFQHNPQF